MKLQASAGDTFTRVESNFVDFRLVKRSVCFRCETASLLYDLFFGFLTLFISSTIFRIQNFSRTTLFHFYDNIISAMTTPLQHNLASLSFCLCLVQLCSSVVQYMIAFLSFAVLMMYLWFFSDTLCVSQMRLCLFSRTALYLSHFALFQQDMNTFYSEYDLNHDLYPRRETKALQFDSL